MMPGNTESRVLDPNADETVQLVCSSIIFSKNQAKLTNRAGRGQTDNLTETKGDHRLKYTRRVEIWTHQGGANNETQVKHFKEKNIKTKQKEEQNLQNKIGKTRNKNRYKQG